MAPSSAWLSALRRYVCVMFVGNLVWEFAQLPFYTLWKAGSARETILAALHCTGGDLLIAGATLVASVVLLGTAEWPRARFLPVAGTTLISGVGVTAYSEHLNTALGAWAYSDLMPILPGTGIGLSPLAQWFVIPILAFIAAQSVISVGHLDLPIMGIIPSRSTLNHLARSDRRMS